MVAEEHAARIRNIRKVIDKLKIDRMCRVCGERERKEMVAHIASECKKLVQEE